MSRSTQIPQISAGSSANGNSRSFSLEGCQQWFDIRGQGPLSLADVGKIVRQKPEVAGDYHTAGGIRFTELLAVNVLESLTAAKQWELLEQIMGIDVEALANDLASRASCAAKLKELGGALREWSAI